MSTTTPRDLMYSAALKPVSIASTAQTRKFLPITSGTYSATGNNIIRIPVNANGFVDMKNAMLKYRVTLADANAYFRGAHSPIQRFQVLSPDGAPLETIDNYNRIVEALEAVEMSRDNMEGFQNLLSGSSANNSALTFQNVADRRFRCIIDGVDMGTIVTATTGSVAQFGDFRFVTTTGSATVPVISISYYNETASLTLGTAGTAVVGGVFFETTTTNTEFFINNVDVGTAASANATTIYPPKNHHAGASSVAMAVGNRVYAHNPLSCLTKLDVLYPAFAVGGGGVVLELTLDSNACVFTAGVSANTPTYTIDAVELIVPVIQYPESVVQSFKQMVNSVGAVSMSSTSLQNYVYPYNFGGVSTNSTLSIPIAVRNRSLKAIYFFFQETQSGTTISRLARDSPTAMNYYLRIGSQYFPAQQISYNTSYTALNLSEAVIELGKSVSKLNDIRHGSILNAKNFVASAANGGQSIFGIDLEASAVSFLENGINTADNALSCYLEISNIAGPNAGNVQIYALFDNTISVMANGNLLVTK